MRCKDSEYLAELVLCPSNHSETPVLRALERSLIAEARSPANIERIRITIQRDGNCVRIELKADTLSHLRAVVNSFLYLIHSAAKSIEMVTTSIVSERRGGNDQHLKSCPS